MNRGYKVKVKHQTAVARLEGDSGGTHLKGRAVKRFLPMVALSIALVGSACSTSSHETTQPPPSPVSSNVAAEPSPPPSPAAKDLKVPNLAGDSLSKAKAEAASAGFESLKVSKKYSHGPSGEVLSQSPKSGAKVAADGVLAISVVVSKAYPKIPSVLHKQLSAARAKLVNRGYKVKVKHQTSNAPKDSVISQSPGGGTEARPGKTVTIVVAKPPPTTSSSGGGGNCTPGYSPCLPVASDYDCAGGSGDGPKYVNGVVTVTGSDPYGLDADNDGQGCE